MVQHLVAKTTQELAQHLQGFKRSSGNWTVQQGPFGHGTVIVYDKEGNIMLEIRNKD